MAKHVILNIISFIISNPGCTAQQIVDELGYERRNINTWLAHLRKYKLVNCQKVKRESDGKWIHIYCWAN